MRLLGALLASVAAAALVCAGGSTPRREDVPKYLNMLLKSTSAKDRAKGAEMLGKRGAISRKDVEEALEPLKKALQKDIDNSVRAAAALALGRIGAEPEETVPLLIESLKAKSIDLKLSVIDALSLYGPAAKAAAKPLREIQKEKTDKKLSMAAGNALKSIFSKMK